MAIPSVSDLTLPVLEFSQKHGEWGFSDSVPELANQFALTDEDRSEEIDSGGVTVFYKRVQWATHRLKKAELIESPSRARYRITTHGHEMLRNPPPQLTASILRKLSPDDAKEVIEPESDDAETPEERIRDAFAQIENALADSLLERLTTWHDDKGQRGRLFERVVIDLLLAMGYGRSLAERGEVLGQTGDGGIDGVISEDSLGLDKIYVQAKCWKNVVPISVVREFVGSLASKGITKGIIITTSKFTGDPRDSLGPIPQRIEFIDGRTLAKLMIEYGVGVKEIKRYVLKREDGDFFDLDE